MPARVTAWFAAHRVVIEKALTDAWTYALAAVVILVSPTDPTTKGAAGVLTGILVNALRRFVSDLRANP